MQSRPLFAANHGDCNNCLDMEIEGTVSCYQISLVINYSDNGELTLDLAMKLRRRQCSSLCGSWAAR